MTLIDDPNPFLMTSYFCPIIPNCTIYITLNIQAKTKKKDNYLLA